MMRVNAPLFRNGLDGLHYSSVEKSQSVIVEEALGYYYLST
jgi:hypothetical protein